MNGQQGTGTGVDEGRRRHYGGFYGIEEVPDGPVGMVHGNCQAESLRVLLELADPARTWVRVPPVHELTAEDLPHLDRLLARTTVVVTQPVRDDYRDLPLGTAQVVARAARGAQHVMAPIVRYRGLHPQQRLVRGPGLPDPPLVPYHHTGAVARAAGLADPLPGADAVRAVAQASLAELRRRQEAAGAVPVDDLLVGAGARATNTINHPGNPVLMGLAQRVAERVGAGAVPDPGRELLRSVFAPVTAATLDALGLEGEPRDDWLVDGRAVPDEEVVATQAAWLRANPRVLAACARAVRDDLLLAGVVGRPRRGAGAGAGGAAGSGGLEPSVAPSGDPEQVATTDTDDALHVVVGPDQHGVVLHARRLAHAGAGELLRLATEDLAPDDVAARAWSAPDGPATRLAGRTVVVHFTDRAFGPTPAAAADALERLVAATASVQVVLHDVPQPSDGTGQEARTAAYHRVCAAADAVVVSSEHERGLLAAATGVDADRIGVVPLPVEREVRQPAGSVTTDEGVPDDVPPGRWVATLGFLYPGKGVEEVVDATAAAARDPRLPADRRPTGVLNLGRPAPGHEELVDALEQRAATAGTRFVTTGWLTEDELAAACRAVDVPVAHHRHVSASGSVNSWLAAGRRPLVADSPYAREQAARMPGALRLVGHDDALHELTGALVDALGDPASTHQGQDTDLWPSWQEAAEMLRNLR
ncbi:WcbI family polysaccharide biosynthesis putative acetyltransferase [Kytococcus schroeteri]|uniref:WcbI family polysaccharide biosynthesis putative acetyltransferase n=1 Tax=Kytococcus schroeteri TaxID=138300 RepID=UPI00114510B4|nr:WcbI family polysaccharide biosynthesis putative acetyltransferase [Kytococcus schroeteri]